MFNYKYYVRGIDSVVYGWFKTKEEAEQEVQELYNKYKIDIFYVVKYGEEN